MADDLCGPSNAFKGLARHFEQDRSHQQDRIASGSQRQAQGFRSTPLNPGLLNQFDAFQQHNAALLQHPTTGWQHYSPSPNVASRPVQAAGPFQQQPAQQSSALATNTGTSWVNDFGRMNFAESRSNPFDTQSTHGPTTGQSSMTGPMHSGLTTRQHQSLLPFQSPAMGLHPIDHYPGGLQNHNRLQDPEPAVATSLALDAQTEALLEQEFEDAMNEWMLQNGPGAEVTNQNELSVQGSGNLGDSLDAASTTSTTQDQDIAEKDSPENRDKLARAAQQLVDSLADNNSEKFKNSDFLALMRRIASQELTVQGNDLVETQPDNNPSPQAATTTTATPSTVAHPPNSPTS